MGRDDLKRLAFFLASNARASGKTTRLATLAREMGGAIIVRNKEEAARCRQELKVQAYAFQGDEFAGKRLGPTFVDPDAVAQIMFTLLHQAWASEHEVKKLTLKINRLKREKRGNTPKRKGK